MIQNFKFLFGPENDFWIPFHANIFRLGLLILLIRKEMTIERVRRNSVAFVILWKKFGFYFNF